MDPPDPLAPTPLYQTLETKVMFLVDKSWS